MGQYALSKEIHSRSTRSLYSQRRIGSLRSKTFGVRNDTQLGFYTQNAVLDGCAESLDEDLAGTAVQILEA